MRMINIQRDKQRRVFLWRDMCEHLCAGNLRCAPAQYDRRYVKTPFSGSQGLTCGQTDMAKLRTRSNWYRVFFRA